jgi:hypothetical protein
MFESQHKYLREDLTATNRQNVGRDVLNVHNSFRIMKFILSGGFKNLSVAEAQVVEQFARPKFMPRDNRSDIADVGKVRYRHKQQQSKVNNVLLLNPDYHQVLNKYIADVTVADGVYMYGQLFLNKDSSVVIDNWVELQWQEQVCVGRVKLIVQLEFPIAPSQTVVVVQLATKTSTTSQYINHFELKQELVALASSHIMKVLHAEHACDIACTIQPTTIKIKHMGTFKTTTANRVKHSNVNSYFVNPFIFK